MNTLPGVPASLAFAIAIAVLWIVALSGTLSNATGLLALIVVVLGLPLSTRYSFGVLRGLNRQRSKAGVSHLGGKAVVVLALLINAWIIFMVVGYALIVGFSLLNGGPIVATA